MVWWRTAKRALVGCAGSVGLLAGILACEVPPTPPAASSSPSDNVEMEVMNPNRPAALRCSPEIRLDRKVSAETLETLSRRLLESEAADCGFGLATYYLPAMRPGMGAWAIAELGPVVSVSILGLSAADEADLLRRAEAQSATPFGVWVDDTSYASVVSLHSDSAGLKLTRFYLDGGTNAEPIRITSAAHGFELRPLAGARSGRHYRIGGDGDLETWDGAGFLSASRKVRVDVDLAALKSEDDGKRAQRARAASAGRSQRRAAALEERWRKFGEWLALYEESLGPARHPVLSLATAQDADDRVAACSKLVTILDRLPSELETAPSPNIDTAPLLASLGDLREACAGGREIKVLVDAAAVTSAWRALERDVEKVVSELRPAEE
jgi:hypothetical protein